MRSKVQVEVEGELNFLFNIHEAGDIFQYPAEFIDEESWLTGCRVRL